MLIFANLPLSKPSLILLSLILPLRYFLFTKLYYMLYSHFSGLRQRAGRAELYKPPGLSQQRADTVWGLS